MQRFPLVLLLAIVFGSPSATAQLPQIRLKSIFPQGGQRGTNVDVVITGTDLDEVTDLVFSDPRLKATAVLDRKKQTVANKFTVFIASDVQPGLYDVRVRGLFGLSNPRIFRIDTIEEAAEKEPNNTTEQAQAIPVNSLINGQSAAADIDVFKVKAARGQTIVFRSEAAIVDSLMQPVMELFDAGGRRVAHARRRGPQEAVIAYTSSEDQTLLLKVHDTVYAGGSEYGYRLSVDTRPQVDFITPSVLPFNQETQVTLFGRHLSDGKATGQSIDGAPVFQKETRIKIDGTMRRRVGTDSSATAIDGIVYSGIDGNLITVALDSRTARHQPEAAAETALSEPQTIKLPARVSGGFAVEMDEDLYRFDAQKGEQWQIDILADRLGSIADPVLIVEQITKDADGKETAKRLAREEANKQNPGGNQLPTLTSDPSFTLVVPQDGTYQIRLKDRYSASRGDVRLTYSLSIQPTAPSCRVVVFDSYPSADGKAPPGTGAISLRKGGTYQVPVYVYRYGGHNEEIRLVSKGTPSGVTLNSGIIPAGKTSAALVITANGDAKPGFGMAQLFALSTKSGQMHPVKVATLVHAGANGLPRTGRVTESLMIGIMKDEEPIHIQPAQTEAEMSQDQQLLIPLKLTRRLGFAEKVDLVFSGQPKNVDIAKVTIAKDVDSATARFYIKENAPVGEATLMMYATAQVPYIRNPWQLERAKSAVAAAKAKVDAETKAEAESKAIAASSKSKVIELAKMLKVYGAAISRAIAEQEQVKAAIKQALSGKADATKQLVAAQNQIQTAVGSIKPDGNNLDAAIQAVEGSTATLQEAARPLTALLKKIAALDTQIAAGQKIVADRNKEIARTKEIIAVQQKANTEAGRLRNKATRALKRLTAELKTLEAAATKAQAAAKPQKKNVRVVAVPIHLTIHATPGKLTAAVPGGGAIKKGATIDVKVTLVRKNKFAGPVKVALVLPNAKTNVTSSVVDIPADRTEAVIQLTAKADSTAGDIAHAVIRATADFNGRQAGFDVPIALKVTD